MAKHQRRVGEDKSEIVGQIPAACADETLAVEFMEKQRWGGCPCCPRCGDTSVVQMKDKAGNRNARYLWRCYGCKRQFTVRINSVYEDSRIPLRYWVFAFWAACASKKGVSAMQIKRQTGLNYRSALFLLNRIRHAMAPTNPPPLHGTIEADEVYLGGKPRKKRKGITGPHPGKLKTPVFVAVARGGEARAMVLDRVTGVNLRMALATCVDPRSRLVTDDFHLYHRAGRPYRIHDRIQHSLGEYVSREDPSIHTNTVEGFFNLFRKRIDGTHHQVSSTHLFRYCDEAVFLYSTRHIEDGARTVKAIRDASGKRLTYKESALLARTA